VSRADRMATRGFAPWATGKRVSQEGAQRGARDLSFAMLFRGVLNGLLIKRFHTPPIAMVLT
jgi:hypothetical protein